DLLTGVYPDLDPVRAGRELPALEVAGPVRALRAQVVPGDVRFWCALRVTAGTHLDVGRAGLGGHLHGDAALLRRRRDRQRWQVRARTVLVQGCTGDELLGSTPVLGHPDLGDREQVPVSTGLALGPVVERQVFGRASDQLGDPV